jgi:glucuronate isomerase
MLYSQGVTLEALGVPTVDGSPTESDPRAIWKIFADHYYLFRGTPSRAWLDWVFAEVFGLDVRLEPATADLYYETIDAALKTPAFRPRALFERFNIEVIATTESPLDPLDHHKAIRESGWQGKVVTAYRPDPVIDPETIGFAENLQAFGVMTGEDVSTWAGYLRAHENRRAFFREAGATSTDHGHPTAFTADLPTAECAALYAKVRSGQADAADAELFRGQMLTEMARMSIDDGMVMQLHPGAHRSHNPSVLARFGRDKGADIPSPTEYVRNLKPLLDKYGNDPRLTLILFTLDEDTYSRELAPLAGHYPALRLGPPWWFHDSPEGMRRFREAATETGGFYNTVGFNDDTRAFLSIPARHDVARRMDCAFLARLVAEHRLEEDEAHELARALTYDLVKAAYKL